MRVITEISLLSMILLVTSVHGEERTFRITVDGKTAGVCRMKTTVSDEIETVEMNYDVKLRVLGIKYEYTSKCSEQWKAGSLQKLDCAVNDDGTKTHVKAELGERGLITTVKGRSVLCSKDALPATGWRIPRLDRQSQEATILDTEDGTTCVAKIEFIGKMQSKLADQTVEGFRYKVTGKGIDAEWAYDANGRPVRQSMKWDGHTVVLELSGIEK